MSNYLSAAEFRTWSDIGVAAGTAEIQLAIDAAEEAVESYCGRTFYRSSTATRYYTAEDSVSVLVDDLVSAATVVTDDDGDGTHETTWAASDFTLEPYNAAADSRPYTHLHASPAIPRILPRTSRGVKITGVWGWPAIPDKVRMATVLQAVRFLKRARSAPMGIESVITSEGVGIRLRAKLDPDVEVMLSGLRRMSAV